MIIKKEITEKTLIPTKVICDICGAAYSTELSSDEIFEAQEFISIRRQGGYGSIFGDEEPIEVDICQYCFKKLVMDKKRNVK
jgi:hypothetical protein